MNLKSLFIKILPPRLRHELIRSKVKLSYDLPGNLEICVADNRQDFEASLNLVYRYYCKIGFCEENSHQMRATLYHALPTTTTIVAKVDQVVVGSLTIVRDNRLGLPIERVGSLDEHRKGGVRLAEITSLVIDKKYRRAEGGLGVLFPLLKFMYEYCTVFFGTQALIATLSPKELYFYESILIFKKLNIKTNDYFGAPAIAMILDLVTAQEKYQAAYGHRSDKNNLYKYFVESDFTNLKKPERKFFRINDPIVDYEYFQDLFVKRLGINQDKNSKERRCLENYLLNADYRRMSPRIDSNLQCETRNEEGQAVCTGQLKDVSIDGFRIIFNGNPNPNSICSVVVKISPDQDVKLTVHNVWNNQETGAGYIVTEKNTAWSEYIRYIYSTEFRKSA